MTNDNFSNKALRASRIGVFASLYIITSLVPISMFIGAPSFLALNIIITPTLAMLLSPLDALFASLFGGVIAFYIAPSQAMFGPYTVLLPVTGATFGSLTYHKSRSGTFASSLFLAFAISAYLIKNYPFPYFVIPHLVAIVVAILSLFQKMTPFYVKMLLYAYVSTMAEQGMMMIFAVHLLGLPWQLFVGILPLMLYERIIATIGATLIILALIRIPIKGLIIDKS